jgi:hypothetical protein
MFRFAFEINATITLIALSLFFSKAISTPAWAQDAHSRPSATFSTLITTPLNIEGMTGDNRGNLYMAGRVNSSGGGMCPVWRVNIENPSLVVVGFLPPSLIHGVQACLPRGLAFDHAGKLYVTERNKIYSFFPDAEHPPVAELFISGEPATGPAAVAADGVAFDRDGNLWAADGTSGDGRVWKISPQRAVTEVFRVQPMANNDPHFFVSYFAGGVGRDVNTVGPGLIHRNPHPYRWGIGGMSSQPMVASGLAFDKDGDLFVADTARGAIWRVRFDGEGNLRSSIGCDTTFPANTLCLENVFVAHPLLEGADGIALDQAGNIWVSVGERNAVVAVTNTGKVTEVFRNAPDATTWRRDQGPLRFPTSPFFSDTKFCTANSHEARRDNWPGGYWPLPYGMVPSGTQIGTISCMDQTLSIQGMPLPVR